MENKTILLNEIARVLDSDKLSMFRGDIGLTEGGEYVQRLEQSFREYFGVNHAVAFNSATSALHAACVACGVGRTIVTPFSFSSSASCVLQAGGIPIFADIDTETYCMTPRDVLAKVTSRTRAIMPVHLFGGCADMDSIIQIASMYDLTVIEDASQAIGSKYKGRYAGTIGDCGIFSFNQSKLISCGEGGMLITNDDEIAFKTKLVRNHGEVVSPESQIVGWNYRMTEVEAIIAFHRFQELDSIIEQRQDNVHYFRKLLSRIKGIKPQWINPDVDYSWYVYSFEVENNHEVARKMTENGIPLRGGYITLPLNMLPIYEYQSCPVCEDVWKHKIVVTDCIKSKKEIEHFAEVLNRVVNG